MLVWVVLYFILFYFIVRTQMYKYRIRLLVKTGCLRNYKIFAYTRFFFLSQQPPVGQRSSLSRLYDHTQTYQTRKESSGWVISPTYRLYLTNTALTRDRHPCLRCNSNSQFQQTRDRRPTPWTGRPLESASIHYALLNTSNVCTKRRSLKNL
jgi:hypothetical protein